MTEEGTVANDILTRDNSTEVMETPTPIEAQREVTSEEDREEVNCQPLLWS